MGCLPGRIEKGLILILVVLICSTVIPARSLAADVDVYAEGAYTATDLVIYLYADINAGPILSFGVKVDYPSTLTYSGATRNEDVWFFGDGTTNYPYMNPEDDGSGVVIIGGRLDTADPTAGVSGTRVLLGTVTFTHTGVTDFSGITLTYGRGDGTGDYKNFVGTDGTVFDGDRAAFGVTILERGDANGDKIITNLDMFAIRALLSGTDYVVYADCNNDGVLTNLDMFCVRSKL